MAERRSRWSRAWRREDFPEIFFPSGRPETPSIVDDEQAERDPEAGFYATAWYEARRRDISGPEVFASDEVEALRAQLLVQLRRQPKDVRVLVRSAEAVSRMMGAKHRKSPKDQLEMVERFLAVFNSLSDEAVFGEAQGTQETVARDPMMPADEPGERRGLNSLNDRRILPPPE